VKGTALRELASQAANDHDLKAIGTIVLNFADLDFAVTHLLEGFAGGDHASEHISTRLKKLSDIADKMVSDKPARKLLSKWIETSGVSLMSVIGSCTTFT
jgi:hypothetical protein